jgi:diamine N-acetyltransferase
MTMSQLLKNDIVTLRALEPTDLDTLFQWENDTALWVVSDTVAPYSREALWNYLQQYTGDIYAQRQLRLMITLTEDGTPVGTVDFLNFDPLNNRAELGLFIAAEQRGKGLGRQALELLTTYAREHLGLRQIYVFIALDNEVCLNLFEDYGYRRAGVLQSWVKRGNTYRDVALLQMIL